MKLGRNTEAIKNQTKAIDINPDNAKAYSQSGEYFFRIYLLGST